MPDIPRRLPPTPAERLNVVVSRMAGGSAAGATRWAQPVATSTYRPEAALGPSEAEPVTPAPLLGVLTDGAAFSLDLLEPDAYYDSPLAVGPLTPGRIYFIEAVILVSNWTGFQPTEPSFTVHYGSHDNIQHATFVIHRIDVGESPSSIQIEYSFFSDNGDPVGGRFMIYAIAANGHRLTAHGENEFGTYGSHEIHDFPSVDFDPIQISRYHVRWTESPTFNFGTEVGWVDWNQAPGNQYPDANTAGSSALRLRFAGPQTDNGSSQMYVNLANSIATAMNMHDPWDMVTQDPETQGVTASFNQFTLGVNYGASVDAMLKLQVKALDPGRAYLVHPTSFIRATDIGAVPQIN